MLNAINESKKIYLKNIGKKVNKFSDKPFKSGQKVNTIKSIERHPVLKHRLAYSFEEDDSIVEVTRCNLIEN